MIKPTITYADFDKLDLRVGKVVTAQAPEWSQKLLEFQVDFGTEIGNRTILAGVKNFYQPAYFVNKHLVFLVNLATKPMGTSESQGMMLAIDAANRPIPWEVTAEVEPGTAIK